MVVRNTVMILILALLISAVAAELERFDHPTKGNGTLTFLVVGDWGGNKEFNQSQVAFQMGRIGEELDIDFVVSTGDNFYKNGLKGVNDPKFVESFTDIYTAKSLQKPWYSVLGNLDYRGDVAAQLSPLLRKLDNRWFCRRSFIVNAEIAEFFFVDTTPFVNEYLNYPKGKKYDWRGVSPVESYTANLLSDLDSALKESGATTKIVVGHHAIWSTTHHGNTPELVDRLLPILKDNKVDLYINGHDHCLQRISDNLSQIQFLTSGAGSKTWGGYVNTTNEGSLDFIHDGHGFMSVRLTRTNMETTFYDVFGKVLHTWSQGRS